MKFSVYQLTRKGGRTKNEDRVGYCYTRDAGLFALADGMGGHPKGDVAAQFALQTLAAAFQREARPTLKEPARFLNDAVLAGHRQLLRYAAQHAVADTPRTTVVACVLQGPSAYWAHCGDSRLYLVRGGRLVGRTRDHSYAELQDSLGAVVPLPARYNRNVLYTCLGGPAVPVVDGAGPVALQGGDRLLLCSDGLWSNTTEAAIVERLTHRPLDEAVPELVERALHEGGETCDNVTAIAMEWESADAAERSGTVMTRTLGEEVFASTIQAGVLGRDSTDDLDDAEIERSIREINDAIRRSAQKKP